MNEPRDAHLQHEEAERRERDYAHARDTEDALDRDIRHAPAPATGEPDLRGPVMHITRFDGPWLTQVLARYPDGSARVWDMPVWPPAGCREYLPDHPAYPHVLREET